MQSDPILIAGGGQAGVTAAFALRRLGWPGGILLAGDEPELPYQRPPLSKDLLRGKLPPEHLQLRPAELFARRGIELLTGTHVERLDPRSRRAWVGGRWQPYHRLLLATGARPRTLPLPGARVLRTLSDALALRDELRPGRRVAVLGGGYLGLEVACTAQEMGCTATVIEAGDRLLCRVASPELATAVLARHRAAGLTLRCGLRALTLSRTDSATWCLALSDGSALEADLVLTAVGATPALELAQEAGLATEFELSVDATCRTSDPAIYAAGDLATQPRAGLAAPLRLESVQNATSQATIAAAAMLGLPPPPAEVPWFWSSQGSTLLQSAGLPAGGEHRVQRPTSQGGLAILHLVGPRLVAIECLNAAAEFQAGRALIASAAPIYPDSLGDAGLSCADAPAAA